MSAEYSFKPEPAALVSPALSELGKSASPMVRAGVLLASIANNVMTNPRNAMIVAVLVLVAMPICWYWKRRASNHERFRPQRHVESGLEKSNRQAIDIA